MSPRLGAMISPSASPDAARFDWTQWIFPGPRRVFTEAEILRHLRLTPQQYQDFLQAEVAEELASFDELVEELARLPSEQRSPEAQLMQTRTIAQALGQLNEREQKVIQLYYEFDASLKEIGAVLDLTEARVSQINKAALTKMRVFLQQQA